MKALASLLLSAALAAAPALARQQDARGFSDHLARLTDIQRKGAIRSAINGSDLSCKRVEALAYQGPYKNLVLWVARCGPKPLVDYGVFIGPDGTAQVRSCADMAKLPLPACRRLP